MPRQIAATSGKTRTDARLLGGRLIVPSSATGSLTSRRCHSISLVWVGACKSQRDEAAIRTGLGRDTRRGGLFGKVIEERVGRNDDHRDSTFFDVFFVEWGSMTQMRWGSRPREGD